MKRTVWAFSCLAIVSGSFVACGKKDNNNKAPIRSATAGKPQDKSNVGPDGKPLLGPNGKPVTEDPGAMTVANLKPMMVPASESCSSSIDMNLAAGEEKVNQLKDLFDERGQGGYWQLINVDVFAEIENKETKEKVSMTGTSGETAAGQALTVIDQKNLRVTCHTMKKKAAPETSKKDKDDEEESANEEAQVKKLISQDFAELKADPRFVFQIDRKTGRTTSQREDVFVVTSDEVRVGSRLVKAELDLKTAPEDEQFTGQIDVVKSLNKTTQDLVIRRRTVEIPRGQSTLTKIFKATYRFVKK